MRHQLYATAGNYLLFATFSRAEGAGGVAVAMGSSSASMSTHIWYRTGCTPRSWVGTYPFSGNGILSSFLKFSDGPD
jgi:hypothetical protein